MSQHRRMLLLGTAFLLVLCLNVNSISASGPARGEWYGLQVPDPTAVPDVTFGRRYIEIRGARMIVIEGYEFGEIAVAYEVIDYMRIIITHPPDPSKPLNIYSYPHYGKITWYDKNGKVVGTGIFVSKGEEAPPYGGRLWVRGPKLLVEGKYWVQKFVEMPINGLTVLYPAVLGHEGSYIITPDGH